MLAGEIQGATGAWTREHLVSLGASGKSSWRKRHLSGDLKVAKQAHKSVLSKGNRPRKEKRTFRELKIVQSEWTMEVEAGKGEVT